MEKRTFYINKPRSIQREVFTKEQKVRQLSFKKKNIYIYIYIYTIMKNLKAKPQQKDPFSALVEEEEPQRWSPWQDPWLCQAKGWHPK